MNRILIAALAFFTACSSSPKATPEEAADEISARIVAGEADDADEIYRVVAKSEAHRTTIYNVLYGGARDAFQRGEYKTSSSLLRFLSGRYPKALAVREALLYSVLMERAGATQPMAVETVAEMDALIKELVTGGKPPVFVDLAAAQVHIDAGRTGAGRAALARFESNWDGTPDGLKAYVAELNRYLDSH
ncbi:MAG: hypothetical protein ACYTGN_13240 [Planctomycetota bacterium]